MERYTIELCWAQWDHWTMLVPLKIDTEIIQVDEVTKAMVLHLAWEMDCREFCEWMQEEPA